MTQKTLSKLSLLALVLMIVLSGCADKTVQRFTANVPQYQSWADFRSQTISIAGPRELVHPGKIYLYHQYLLVNEVMQGIHIYDNSVPSNPVNLGFLPIHANIDMAVNNNILYVDSYSDLLAFNISDPAHPTLVQRVNDVFTFSAHGLLNGYDNAYPMIYPDATQGVVLSWNVEETMQESNNIGWCGVGWGREGDIVTFDATSISAGLGTGSTANVGGTGIAGSLARFAIAADHLYVLQGWTMNVFSIAGDIREVREVNSGLSGETLFPADGHLYIGGTTGMAIFSLADPANPVYITLYSHINSCDPVVVQGDYAYVTLRTGNTCEGTNNSLEVVDISNKANPTLVASFNMTNPRGLGVDDNTLFLCDGPDGLKVFDKTDHATIPQHLLGQFTGIDANDVIPHNEVLIMTAQEGIYQYSYADPANVTQLSLIPAQR
jgi:hypothetical protein